MRAQVTLERPWLRMDLGQEMRVLSWAPYGAGFTPARAILWREVRNADLTPGFDAEAWLAAQMPPQAVGLLTSRDVGTFHESFAEVEGIAAQCVATVGLSNAESVGRRLAYHTADAAADALTAPAAGPAAAPPGMGARGYGTINIGLCLGAGLTEAAQLEAMSIAVQARTAAVMAAGIDLATGRATGTGTDCVALACLPGELRYAGLHTAVGEAVGAAVRDCLTRACEAWLLWRAAEAGRRAASGQTPSGQGQA